MAHFKKFITVAVALFLASNQGTNALHSKKFASISQQVDTIEKEQQLENENTIQTITDLSLETSSIKKKDDQEYNAK